MNGFPPDLPIALDRRTVVLPDGRTLFGGTPARVLRLSESGRAVLERLHRSGAGPSPSARSLARLLVDAELAHPRPQPTGTSAADVTVVIPVRDQAASLDRCLKALALPALVVDDASADATAIAEVCERNGAGLVRRERRGGPGVARNTGVAHTTGELIAFLDSDCVPSRGWVSALAGHFADPLVAAVAPRVIPVTRLRPTALDRYATARSPLDLGPDPADVAPGRRVGYVPSAALIVRRAAFGAGFDPRLRYGEDVDLVWRLTRQDWRVRYDPAVTVDHDEPRTLRTLLARRYRYGTSAGPLAQRHGRALTPAVFDGRPAATLGLLLCGRPRLAGTAMAYLVRCAARRTGAVGLPRRHAWLGSARLVSRTTIAAGRYATTVAPAAFVLALMCRRTRRPATILLGAVPLTDWLRLRPGLDPVRWSLGCLADDLAYGTGVWAGALTAGTLTPLRPVMNPRAHDRHSTWA